MINNFGALFKIRQLANILSIETNAFLIWFFIKILLDYEQ